MAQETVDEYLEKLRKELLESLEYNYETTFLNARELSQFDLGEKCGYRRGIEEVLFLIRNKLKYGT